MVGADRERTTDRAKKQQVFYHRKDKATGLPTEQTPAYQQQREQQLAEARGALLILAPWGLEGDSDYARFHRLNDLAAEV